MPESQHFRADYEWAHYALRLKHGAVLVGNLQDFNRWLAQIVPDWPGYGLTDGEISYPFSPLYMSRTSAQALISDLDVLYEEWFFRH
jgi:hypothetical protein